MCVCVCIVVCALAAPKPAADDLLGTVDCIRCLVLGCFAGVKDIDTSVRTMSDVTDQKETIWFGSAVLSKCGASCEPRPDSSNFLCMWARAVEVAAQRCGCTCHGRHRRLPGVEPCAVSTRRLSRHQGRAARGLGDAPAHEGRTTSTPRHLSPPSWPPSGPSLVRVACCSS